MAKNRKKRRRDQRRENPPRMVMKPRDIDVVEAVHRYRILRQDQLQTLFFGSRTRAQSRLEKLFDHGFLDRRFLPVTLGQGRSPTLYVLDRRGADLLRAMRGYDELTIARDTKPDFLEHTLAINDVMIAFNKASRSSGIQIERWLTEYELKADYDYVTIPGPRGRPEKKSVIPDGYFTILHQKDGETRRHPFFLELDRGTMPLRRFKTKVLAYLAYLRDGGYERRYGTRSIRVLTVTTADTRARNLKVAAESEGNSHWFWFSTLDRVNDANVLSDPIWYQAGKQDAQTLFEV